MEKVLKIAQSLIQSQLDGFKEEEFEGSREILCWPGTEDEISFHIDRCKVGYKDGKGLYELFSSWLHTLGLNFSDIALNEESGRLEFESEFLTMDWKRYHAKNAELRLINDLK